MRPILRRLPTGGTVLATLTYMATPDNDAQNPLANEDTNEPRRRTEAEDRATHGQSLAQGDTGDGGTGVPADVQGISNRPGDAPEDDR
jgi:hypothetical protein